VTIVTASHGTLTTWDPVNTTHTAVPGGWPGSAPELS